MTFESKLSRAADAAVRLDDAYSPDDAEPNEAWLIPYGAGLVLGYAAGQNPQVRAEFDQALARMCDYVLEAAQRLDEKGG